MPNPDDKTVLIVDDNVDNIRVLGSFLRQEGYRVAASTSGQEALKQASTLQPDLLLLDIMMPVMDGFDTCKALKSKIDTQHIPIFFLTALTDIDSIVEGFEVGAVDYVTKPFNRETLLARVETHLQLADSGRDLEQINSQLRLERDQQSDLLLRLQETQAELLHAEKMASIGLFAAGIAHEINNPLSSIKSNLGSLETYITDLLALIQLQNDGLENLADDAPTAQQQSRAFMDRIEFDFLKKDIPQMIDEARQSTTRVSGIVKDLLHFSQYDEEAFDWFDLAQELELSIRLTPIPAGKKIQFRRQFVDLAKIQCKPQQISQVFMNLISNAIHAIDEEGTITLSTGCDDNRVWVEVSDNGCGIDTEIVGKVYDPFFTTREVGGGMGLGLSVAYGIVRHHQGSLSVVSRPHEGSCFRVELPIRQVASGRHSSD